jgi:predicted lysophospholipase L1 biosynthesis ABC-type transport system permease subunit
LLGIGLAAVLWRLLWRYRVDGRLILRETMGRRGRVASTLLGLSVGITGLSVVSLTTDGVSRLLKIQIDQNLEGNLLVVSPLESQREAVKTALSSTEGIESFYQLTTYDNAVLVEINGKEAKPLYEHRKREQDDPAENSNYERAENGIPLPITELETLDGLPNYEMLDGTNFKPGDEGTYKILVRESLYTEAMKIKSGDVLLFVFENKPGKEDDITIRLRVVGIIAMNSERRYLGDMFMVPPGTLTGRPEEIRPRPMSVLTIVQVDKSKPEYMDQALAKVSDIPGTLPIELSALTQLIEDMMNQLKAIPTLVAWLALVAGTAIIANTVALATQERRRQIGVMKAVGLKGQRILGMLVIENGLIGLIAGLIGGVVGLGITVVLVLTTETPKELRQVIEFSTLGWLLVMSIGVAVGAAILSAWSAAAEKPMNVLRYE